MSGLSVGRRGRHGWSRRRGRSIRLRVGWSDGWPVSIAVRVRRGGVEQFDIEDEIGLRRNDRRTTGETIGKLPGDEQATDAADVHADESGVPAGNDLMAAEDELKWLTLGKLRAGAVAGGVELCAVGGEPAGVLDGEHHAGCGDGSGAGANLLIAQGVGSEDRRVDGRDALRRWRWGWLGACLRGWLGDGRSRRKCEREQRGVKAAACEGTRIVHRVCLDSAASFAIGYRCEIRVVQSAYIFFLAGMPCASTVGHGILFRS